MDLLAAPVVQGRVTRVADHRPWPLPPGPWVMGQTWVDLLFAHWPVEPAAMARSVPPQLELDTFDGYAWLGITPFVVRNLRLRPGWPLPWFSSFGEINVRTYVTADGRPGIYFLSLDAASRLAVAVARRWYRLPYFRASISPERRDHEIDYRSQRLGDEGPPARFSADYGPRGDVFQAMPSTLEHFLTERYCLYTLDDRRRVLRGDIHHPTWPLQPASAQIAANTMADEAALTLPGEPLLHFSARQDVVFWPLRPARG